MPQTGKRFLGFSLVNRKEVGSEWARKWIASVSRSFKKRRLQETSSKKQRFFSFPGNYNDYEYILFHSPSLTEKFQSLKDRVVRIRMSGKMHGFSLPGRSLGLIWQPNCLARELIIRHKHCQKLGRRVSNSLTHKLFGTKNWRNFTQRNLF